MLRELMDDNKQIAAAMRKAHKTVDDLEDAATAGSAGKLHRRNRKAHLVPVRSHAPGRRQRGVKATVPRRERYFTSPRSSRGEVGSRSDPGEGRGTASTLLADSPVASSAASRADAFRPALLPFEFDSVPGPSPARLRRSTSPREERGEVKSGSPQRGHSGMRACWRADPESRDWYKGCCPPREIPGSPAADAACAPE